MMPTCWPCSSNGRCDQFALIKSIHLDYLPDNCQVTISRNYWATIVRLQFENSNPERVNGARRIVGQTTNSRFDICMAICIDSVRFKASDNLMSRQIYWRWTRLTLLPRLKSVYHILCARLSFALANSNSFPNEDRPTTSLPLRATSERCFWPCGIDLIWLGSVKTGRHSEQAINVSIRCRTSPRILRQALQLFLTMNLKRTTTWTTSFYDQQSSLQEVPMNLAILQIISLQFAAFRRID